MRQVPARAYKWRATQARIYVAFTDNFQASNVYERV